MQQVQDQLDFPIDTPSNEQMRQLHEHRQEMLNDMHTEHTRVSREFTEAKTLGRPTTKNQKKRTRRKARSK